MSKKNINLKWLIKLAAELLYSIINETHGADQILFHYFKNHHQLGSQTRRLITEIIYDSLRRLRSLGYMLGCNELSSGQLSNQQAQLIIIAWLLTKGDYSKNDISLAAGHEILLNLKNSFISNTLLYYLQKDLIIQLIKYLFKQNFIENELNFIFKILNLFKDIIKQEKINKIISISLINLLFYYYIIFI